MWLSKEDHFAAWKGLSLLALSCNHLILWPLSDLSIFLKLTYQSIGWFTFASLYFAIAGIQWGRRVQIVDSFWQWNLKRAARLMFWVIVSTTIFCFGIELNIWRPAPWQQHLNWNLRSTIPYSILGIRIPWLVDVIWLHCALGLFTALLWKLPILRANFRLILTFSFLVWFSSYIGAFDLQIHQSQAPSWHHFSSWQLLFVASAVSQQKKYNIYIKKITDKKATNVIACLALIMLFCKFIFKLSSHKDIVDIQKFGPIFAINSIILLTLLQLTEKRNFPNFIKRVGKYSLRGYSLQCFLVYLLGSIEYIQNAGIFLSGLFLILSILSIVIFSGNFKNGE